MSRASPGARARTGRTEEVRGGNHLPRFARRVRDRMLRPTFGAVTGVRTSAKVAALTFDDGPNPMVTPELLELFERHGAKATHFMVGDLAERQPELVEAVKRRGHAVGSHGYDHPSFVRIDAKARAEQLKRGKGALGPGAAPLFRPPYGHFDLGTALSVRAAGLTAVTWTRHCLDWEVHDVAFLATRLREALVPGAIILLHEGLYSTENPDEANDRGPMLAALEQVLREAAGTWDFVTVPELLRRGRPRRTLNAKLGSDAIMRAQRPGEVWRLVHDADAAASPPREGP